MDVAEAEKTIGFRVPAAYMDFLRVNGGGASEQYVIDIPGFYCAIELWGALKAAPGCEGLLVQNMVRNSQDFVPSGHVPIANTVTHDILFIPLVGDAIVSLWDSNPPNQIQSSNLPLKEFLDALSENPEN
ncbi:MAG TPA: SMI1/KNR4 family protein [Planctomycetota bacterium]|nr:SMI1/KNR4 family protein [Planctomycetota bacterium]